MLAVPIGGALLVALGSMVLSVALWRARTVPGWVRVLGIVTAVTGIVVPPDTIAASSPTASSATAVAVGWYAWRRPVKTDDARHGTTTRATGPGFRPWSRAGRLGTETEGPR